MFIDNKIEQKNRLVYKLIKTTMENLCVGDLFCLDDGPKGPERLDKIFRCKSKPTFCVTVEILNAELPV